ncbi:uncharacterized protein BDZ99DRAFT_524946 [Mytilinidion resinicola]|uniref:Uncharacterized protein n=1 Tax=Mytilinidion resinicola TaxID=574789 RepID=A0A6A6Y8R9_9PEZI|nr:uncharacterized protein BDZ99DRAFT_524946 [Mytilinidion resinicola]KAF2805236.1 hypothetical protein BDZ99DRAFT_524946 [Mytilinidion resinicola]
MNPLLTHWPDFPDPDFPNTLLSGSNSNSNSNSTPTRLHLLTTINALGLSKTLDDLPGPTAARLRASRRRNWTAYAAWLADVRAQLWQCSPGRRVPLHRDRAGVLVAGRGGHDGHPGAAALRGDAGRGLVGREALAEGG